MKKPLNLLKRLALVILGIFAAVAAWYGQGRLFRDSRAVRVLKLADGELRPTANSEFHVACFNIAHGRGPVTGADNWNSVERKRPQEHISAIAGQIRAAGAAIVVLNEVDFDSKWSGGLDFARLIAEEAGFPFVVEQRNIDVTLPFFTLRFGNAILSRFPVTDARLLRFPALSAWEDAFAGNHDGVVATLEAPGGPVRVVAVHLEYRDESARVGAARVIARLISESAEVPVIAMGDFNSTPEGYPAHEKASDGENAIEVMESEAGMRTNRRKVPSPADLTFPSLEPSRVIDWVFVSDGLELTSRAVVPSLLSDHLMVTGSVVRAARN